MQANKIALVVIENPLLDITVQDNDDVIHTKFGLVHGQASLVTEENMGIHDELFARDDKEVTLGGAALNSARACNHILKKINFDGDVAFVGCIGNDDSGKLLSKCVDEVKMHGVFSTCEVTPTGRCAVVVHGKERTLCANIGASQKYPTADFHSQIAIFEKASMIYSTGFFITSNDEALKKVCEFATEHDKPFAFNFGAVFLLMIAKDSVLKCIEHADYVFCNEDEGSAYAKVVGIDEKDRVGAARHIAESKKANTKRPRVSIITQGSDSVIVATNDGKDTKVFEVEVPKIDKSLIVDTNGAGDAFTGGFLAALAQGKDVEECVKDGIKLSALVVQRLGATFE